MGRWKVQSQSTPKFLRRLTILGSSRILFLAQTAPCLCLAGLLEEKLACLSAGTFPQLPRCRIPRVH